MSDGWFILSSNTLKKFKEKYPYVPGRIQWVTLHWSAGNYLNASPKYNFSIQGDGVILVNPEGPYATLGHTWHRNTGNIGISCLCMLNAQTPPGSYKPDLKNWPSCYGPCPPTPAQIKSMIWLCSILLRYFQLSFDCLKTHCDWAEIDEYGPSFNCERWDWWKEGPIIKAKVKQEYIETKPKK